MIALRRLRYHLRRRVFRFLFGSCPEVRAGMLCSGWSVHPGPHTFSNREWRRTRGLLTPKPSISKGGE